MFLETNFFLKQKSLIFVIISLEFWSQYFNYILRQKLLFLIIKLVFSVIFAKAQGIICLALRSDIYQWSENYKQTR